MTPKEKALELYHKFRNANGSLSGNGYAKKQAILCAEEILNLPKTTGLGTFKPIIREDYDYWKEVKQELENL